MSKTEELRRAALNYAERGWHVFPVKPKGKEPAIKWKEGRTTDREAIQEIWKTKPWNIGIATGPISGIVVLDIDTAKLDEKSRLFVNSVEDTCKTFTVKTGSGGFHFYFKCPSIPLGNRVNANGLKGIDFRGDGGLVVAGGSIHPNGNSYEVISDIEPIEIPQWLFDTLWPAKPAPSEKAALAITGDKRGKLSRATLEFMINGADHADDGSWNHRLFKAARDYHEQGYSLDEFLAVAERITGHLDEKDMATIVKSAFANDPKYEPRGVEEAEEQSATVLAKIFLNQSGLAETLKYWQKGFYQWEKTHYYEITKEELKIKLIRWLQDSPGLSRAINSRLIEDTILNIVGRIGISGRQAPPSWLEGSESSALISMTNGLLDPSSGRLIEHSPNFFNFTCLPYSYDPAATCPTWLKFLEEVQPDPDVRKLLQEWYGYNLTLDTTQAKFALFEGEGANGKTVCCVVLRELLGAKNITHVGLEAFNAERTFPLAVTVGKLANIVEELNEIDKAQEGLLKQFTSGGAITVERKHQDPFTLIPTAKLTFATNILPRFVDRSMGIWRRMLYIPFRFQILDESKQDKRLVQSEFWRAELPGIFNWALEGLNRLKQNGRFTSPKVCTEATETYRLEMNPAQAFLIDNYRAVPEAVIPKADIFEEYVEWIRAQEHRPLSQTQFNREVKRYFRSIEEKVARAGGRLAKVWVGLEKLESQSDQSSHQDILAKKKI